MGARSAEPSGRSPDPCDVGARRMPSRAVTGSNRANGGGSRLARSTERGGPDPRSIRSSAVPGSRTVRRSCCPSGERAAPNFAHDRIAILGPPTWPARCCARRQRAIARSRSGLARVTGGPRTVSLRQASVRSGSSRLRCDLTSPSAGDTLFAYSIICSYLRTQRGTTRGKSRSGRNRADRSERQRSVSQTVPPASRQLPAAFAAPTVQVWRAQHRPTTTARARSDMCDGFDHQHSSTTTGEFQ